MHLCVVHRYILATLNITKIRVPLAVCLLASGTETALNEARTRALCDTDIAVQQFRPYVRKDWLGEADSRIFLQLSVTNVPKIHHGRRFAIE
jgi:hypothetical protein